MWLGISALIVSQRERLSSTCRREPRYCSSLSVPRKPLHSSHLPLSCFLPLPFLPPSLPHPHPHPPSLHHLLTLTLPPSLHRPLTLTLSPSITPSPSLSLPLSPSLPPSPSQTSWLRKWKLQGSAKSIKKNKNCHQLVAAYKVFCCSSAQYTV